MDNLIHKLRNMANTLRLVYEQDRGLQSRRNPGFSWVYVMNFTGWKSEKTGGYHAHLVQKIKDKQGLSKTE